MTSFSDKLIRPGLFFRIETETPVRFWTGVGPRHLATDAVETTGGIYLGLDLNVDLPKFSMLFNGKAESVTVNLSGVDAKLLNLVDLESSLIRDCVVNIGVSLLDADWQIATAPYWMLGQRIAEVGFSLNPTGDPTSDSSHEAGISLTLNYGNNRRRRPKGGYWTQVRAKSGDTGFRHVPGLAAGVTRVYPPA